MKMTATRLLAINIVLIVLNALGVGFILFKAFYRPGSSVFLQDAFLVPDSDTPDRLRLIFDRNVVSDKDLGKIEKRALLEIRPDCPGKLMWTEPDVLEYVFDNPLTLGRIYSADLTERFARRTGMVVANKKSIEFQTSPLRLDSFHALASDESDVTVELKFNQKIDPADLLRSAILYDGEGIEGQRISSMQCMTPSPAEKIVLRLPRPSSHNLFLRIDERLRSPGADLPLQSPVSRRLNLDPGFAFLHAEIEIPQFSEIGSVRLNFSRELSTKQILPEIPVTPPVEEMKIYRSDASLVVSGKFLPEHRYTLSIPSLLCSSQDKTLGKGVLVVVEIPQRRPGISLQGQRKGILSPYGSREIEVKAVNVSSLEFSAWRVYENNLAAYLHDNSRDETSRDLPKKTIVCDLPRNKIQPYAVQLKDLIEPGPGIYYLQVGSSSNRWARDRMLVSLSDLGITVKSDKDGCLVWVTSIRHGTPIKDATVKAITYNNQTLATGQTDPNGIVRLEYSSSGKDRGMWVVTAQKEDDLGYLIAGNNRWMIDDAFSDNDGMPYPEDVEAMVYSERGVYRPGDTVHLTGILRRANGAIPPAFPVRLLIRRPDGRQIEDRVLQRSQEQQGFFHADFPTHEDMQTGMYSFDVALPGSETTIGNTTVFVEAFLPQRMKVTATPTAQRYSPDEKPTVNATAAYLWDAPACELPLRIEPWLTPIRLQPQSLKEYQFGRPLSSGPIHLPTIMEKLDGSGNAKVEIPLQENIPNALYRLRYSVTVTEPGSRSVSDNGSMIVDRLGKHIGLKMPGGTLVSPGAPCAVDWVCVATDESETAPGPLQIQWMTVKYESVLTQISGRAVWKSQEKIQILKTETFQAAGASRGSIAFTCPDAGWYRLIVIDTVSGSESWLDVYSSENGAEQNLSMNEPDRLEIVIDQPRYVPGSTVRALVRSPLSGTMLVALETDRVIWQKIVEMRKNSAEVSVRLPKDLRGGAYLTATVVRAVDPNQPRWLPHRAMGIKPIRLDHELRRLPLKIAVPESVRPGQEMTVEVSTQPAIDPNQPAMVHVWAVDEGILLPTEFQTPDPFRFFLSPRLPGVGTSDVFFDLLPDYQRPDSFARIGADGPDHQVRGLRRSPVRKDRVEPAVIWCEAVELNARGQASVKMKIPELIGQIRVMAVAVDRDHYGKAERPVVMTSPLFIESGWPRFAAPGDQFDVPVKVFNSTGADVAVQLEAVGSEPVMIENPSAQLTVASGKPLTYLLHVQARQMGLASIQLKAAGVDSASRPLTVVVSISLPIRPATALHSRVQTLSVPAGKELLLEPSKEFIPDTEQRTLFIGARPTVELEPVFERLIRYPYGCLEQTTSRLFAMIEAPKILDPARAEAIGEMVSAGISRIWSMQTLSGGLSFWQGGTDSSLWASAYAGWCMLEAQKAGYPVDKRFLEVLLKYLDSQLNHPDSEDPAGTRALICHVLSGFDRPRLGWMNGLAERRDRLDPAGIAHLAAAFHAAGMTDKARSLLSDEPVMPASDSVSYGQMHSRLQQTATWLMVLLEVDPRDARIPPMVKRIMDARQNGCWASTLENSAALMALTRYQAAAEKDPPDFTGTIRMADGKEFVFTHETPLSRQMEKVSGPMMIASTGQGTIYVSSSSEGLAVRDSLQPYSKNLVVTRQWLDRTGKTIDANDLHVGDLIQVLIRIETNLKSPVDNIVIVDALPGGMEVENPRLATSGTGAQSEITQADHVEFLDDRVVIFCTVRREAQEHRYPLRLVTAGVFDIPPIQASSMYDPAIAAMGPIGRIRIRP